MGYPKFGIETILALSMANTPLLCARARACVYMNMKTIMRDKGSILAQVVYNKNVEQKKLIHSNGACRGFMRTRKLPIVFFSLHLLFYLSIKSTRIVRGTGPTTHANIIMNIYKFG